MTDAPTTTPRNEIVVAEFRKNHRETIRVATSLYHGHDLAHVRVWVPSADGSTLIPTKAGLSVRRALLGDLIDALQKARDAEPMAPEKQVAA